MSGSLQFETPENVQIEHHTAGLGTRFIAWFVDGILVNLFIFLLFIVLAIVGALSESVLNDWFKNVDRIVKQQDQKTDPELIVMYFVGIAMLIWGVGSFLYFGLSELFWRGQTIGKRLSNIRVVKTDGFALDALSIFIRNIFRVADQLPILWIVPFLSKRGQRFGDMVAGTIVISNESDALPEVREELSTRSAAEARFRFDNAKLSRLTRNDFDSIEQILDRWESIPASMKIKLRDQVVGAVCKKLQHEEPPIEQRVEFLEDLMAAEFRRQDRHLK